MRATSPHDNPNSRRAANVSPSSLFPQRLSTGVILVRGTPIRAMRFERRTAASTDAASGDATTKHLSHADTAAATASLQWADVSAMTTSASSLKTSSRKSTAPPTSSARSGLSTGPHMVRQGATRTEDLTMDSSSKAPLAAGSMRCSRFAGSGAPTTAARLPNMRSRSSRAVLSPAASVVAPLPPRPLVTAITDAFLAACGEGFLPAGANDTESGSSRSMSPPPEGPRGAAS